MEAQNSHHGQINEISGEMPVGGLTLGTNKICAGASCGFSDSETISKDAKERSASMRKLLMAVVLCIIFMSVEVVGGIKANSLAILTDAAHLLSDVAAFAISLFSLWASGWEANPRQSYGFFRIEILGALVSIQMIWLLAGILVYEAVARIIHDAGSVDGSLMFAVSAFGLVVNIVMAVLLGHDHSHHGHGHGHSDQSHDHDHGADHNHAISVTMHQQHQHHHQHAESKNKEEHRQTVHQHHHQCAGAMNKDEQKHTVIHVDNVDLNEPLLDNSTDCCESNCYSEPSKPKKSRNINVQGAYLHVLGDSIQSVGVMISGAIIWYKPEWKIIDLICTLIFSIVVLGTTIRMLRSILEVLMESTPREIDATRLEKGLCEMDGVVAVHELHIWAITVGKVLLACHVTITREADADLILDKVIGYIRREYNISHVTIQIERQ